VEKNEFHYFWPLLEKFLEMSTSGHPLEKILPTPRTETTQKQLVQFAKRMQGRRVLIYRRT